MPLSSEAKLLLTKYLEARTDSDPALFVSNRGSRVSARAVQHMLAEYGVHPYKLRHTFCREMEEAMEKAFS